jgi:hypothetical protein
VTVQASTSSLAYRNFLLGAMVLYEGAIPAGTLPIAVRAPAWNAKSWMLASS